MNRPSQPSVAGSPDANGTATPEVKLHQTQSHSTKDAPGADPASVRGGSSDEARKALQLLEQLQKLSTTPAIQALATGAGEWMKAHSQAQLESVKLQTQVAKENAAYFRSNRIYMILGLLLCFVFLFGVIWLFRDKPDTLLPILTALIGLIAGSGGGFFFGRHSGTSKQ